MKRRLIAIVLVLSALGVTLGIRFLTSPRIEAFMRRELSKLAREQLGAELRVGQVDHDFLLTRLSLYDVTLSAAAVPAGEGTGRRITVRRLEAVVDPFSPLRGRISFREIRLEGVSLAVDRGTDGRLVVEPLRSFWAARAGEPPAFTARVDSFTLLDTSLALHDPSLGLEGELTGVMFNLRRRMLDPEGMYRISLGARGGKASWRSLAGGKPLAVRALQGRMTWASREIAVESLLLGLGPFALDLAGTLPLDGRALQGTATLAFEASELPGEASLAGRVNIEGSVTGDPSSPVFHGKLRCPVLTLRGTRLDEVKADLSLDARRIALDGLSLRLRGATMRGEAEMGMDEGMPFRARASIEGYPVGRLLAGAGLDETDMEATLDARAEAAGLLAPPGEPAGNAPGGSGNRVDPGISLKLEGRAALAIDAASAERRFFTIDAEGSWRGEAFTIARGIVSSGSLAVGLSGDFSRTGPRLDFTLRDRVLAGWSSSAGWGRGLGGDLRVDGRVEGPWGEPAGRVEVRWSRPEWGGGQADLLQAHLDLDARALRCPLASLRAGGTTATFSGTLPLHGGGEPGRFALAIPAGRVEDLLSVLGSDLVGAGAVSGTVEGSSSSGGWEGRGVLAGKGVVLAEEKADAVRLPFRFAGGRLVLEPAAIEKDGMTVALEGSMEKGGFELFVRTLQPLRLDRLAVFPRIKAPLGGGIDLTARARGAISSLADAEVDAEVSSSALSYEGRSWRGAKASFRIRRKNLAVEGTLFDGKVSARVSLGLLGGLPFRGDLTAAGMSREEINDFLVLGIPERVAGRLDATVNAEGLLSDTQTTRAAGTIEKAEVRVGDLALIALEPVPFTYHPPEGASFSNLVVKTGESVLRGAVRLRRDGGLEGSVMGEIDLAGLPFLAPTVTDFAGKCRVEITTGGTVEAPRLEGYAELSGVSCIAHLPFPLPCRRLGGRIEVLRDRLHFSAISGEAGGGLVEMTGDLFFAGLVPVRGQLTWNAERVRVTYPRELTATGRASITLTFTEGKGTLRGTILADESRYANQVDLENLIGLIGEAARGRREGETAAGGARGGEGGEGGEIKEVEWLVLDLAMETVNPLEANLKILRGQAVGALRLQGPAGRPVLSGRLDVFPATIEYRGHVFNVTRGWVGFFNPRIIEPTYDIRGRTKVSGLDAGGRFRDYLVDLSVTGTPARTELDLYSDPPLGRLDILALLTWGGVTSRILERGEGISTVGATLLLTSQLKGRIESGVQSIIGFDRFVINPVQASASGERDMWVQVDKSLGERLHLTYSAPVGATGDHQVELRYRVTDVFSILGSQQGENEVGLDLDFSFEIP
jgi:hypothetical protein